MKRIPSHAIALCQWQLPSKYKLFVVFLCFCIYVFTIVSINNKEIDPDPLVVQGTCICLQTIVLAAFCHVACWHHPLQKTLTQNTLLNFTWTICLRCSFRTIRALAQRSGISRCLRSTNLDLLILLSNMRDIRDIYIYIWHIHDIYSTYTWHIHDIYVTYMWQCAIYEVPFHHLLSFCAIC